MHTQSDCVIRRARRGNAPVMILSMFKWSASDRVHFLGRLNLAHKLGALARTNRNITGTAFERPNQYTAGHLVAASALSSFRVKQKPHFRRHAAHVQSFRCHFPHLCPAPYLLTCCLCHQLPAILNAHSALMSGTGLELRSASPAGYRY